MFERFFKGNQKEAAVTNEKMLAGELRTPQEGSYFKNIEKIVALLTLAGIILPLASIDKAVAGGPPETKQISEDSSQAEAGKQKMAELLQRIKSEKGLEVVMAGRSFVGAQEQTKEVAKTEKIYRDACQNVKKNQTPYQEIAFMAENQPIALENFLNDFGLKINPEVRKILDQADYRAVFCYRDAKNIDRGFRFGIAQPTSEQAYYEDLYAAIDSNLKKWEPTIFADFKNVFFPDSELPKSANFQGADFEKIPIRHATANGLAVAYAVFDGNLFVANNLDCLKAMLQAAEPEGDAASQGKTWSKK